jgi:hypothetical protein
MQEQKQSKKSKEENLELISDQIKRDISRLEIDPFAEEKLKKKIQKLYFWIWILLGISALFFTIILLGK